MARCNQSRGAEVQSQCILRCIRNDNEPLIVTSCSIEQVTYTCVSNQLSPTRVSRM